MVVPTKVGLNDNLILELIGLPHSLDRAVHQINFLFWTGSRDHSKTFLPLALFYQSTLSWLKVRGGNEQSGMLVAHVIFVSAQGPNPSFFLFIRLLFDLGACWDQDLDQGLTIGQNLTSNSPLIIFHV